MLLMPWLAASFSHNNIATLMSMEHTTMQLHKWDHLLMHQTQAQLESITANFHTNSCK